MKERHFVFIPLFLVIFLALYNNLALHYHLYWFLWWFDIPVHVMGGAVLGFVGLWLFFRSGLFKIARNRRSVFVYTMIFTIAIGVFWEIFEYSVGNAFNPILSYPLDTVKDMLSNLTGSFIAIVFDDGYERA